MFVQRWVTALRRHIITVSGKQCCCCSQSPGRSKIKVIHPHRWVQNSSWWSWRLPVLINNKVLSLLLTINNKVGLVKRCTGTPPHLLHPTPQEQLGSGTISGQGSWLLITAEYETTEKTKQNKNKRGDLTQVKSEAIQQLCQVIRFPFWFGKHFEWPLCAIRCDGNK